MDKKNSIVISLNDDISEIIDLAESLNYKTVETFIQKRKNPDVNNYIGSGKVNEIKEFLEDYKKEIDLIIVDGELKPSQWFTLEKKLNKDVYDRIRLILAIFEERAERKEAKLQVRLAQLQYERPYVRELIHRARAGEHPGFMAGGEYQVDDYYEMIKKQMKKTKSSLEKIRNERKLRRRNRHISGFHLVSLAGYTNAGKSSLLNKLSGEKVNVEGRLFSTLSTTTRRIANKNMPILLTDTVGFIQNLPAWIIDAFHSTLEEIEVADVVLLVADISEKEKILEKKLKVSMDELFDLGVTSPILIALNKIDMLTEAEINEKIKYLRDLEFTNDRKIIPISIKNNENIELLLNTIYDSIPQQTELTLKLPNNKDTQSLISWIYEKAKVTDIVYDKDIKVTIVCNSLIKDIIISKCYKLKGSLI